MVGKLPAQLAYIYADKLYLFICYSITFYVMDQDFKLGIILLIPLLFGHAHFLTATLHP